MSLPSKSLWARAFIEQASIDLDFAVALQDLVRNQAIRARFGSRPDVYSAIMYAYCQQAIEKALKAWLWHSRNWIPMYHNPLDAVLESREMKTQTRPEFLNIVSRTSGFLAKILDMAPGAVKEREKKETTLRRPNTEYPFAASSKRVMLPHQELSLSDAASALKVAVPLVKSIRKYFEVVGLARA